MNATCIFLCLFVFAFVVSQWRRVIKVEEGDKTCVRVCVRVCACGSTIWHTGIAGNRIDT